ncbi:GNAT family N-acetyltransferase [Planococcus shenhongbingii]|uniref:GNAT family N-acetyltransferase n=1 Tax=Planococcus shenhongbingii TaxID=3058398 RepID=A0ABT8NGD6_9BACL|nr:MULTISPECIES: GNAT family N-acetyltransferase [unclassified Planococcus (in: firmicutes)]MDN7246945.1 GNAT family N-acetyltransferase [Planococcus sp. N017]WKA56848.1 GNAT family N-acetyltransferase [Planococcus sp. N016]
MSSPNGIRITEEPPADFRAVFQLYRELAWDALGLTADDLEGMCQQSWFVSYAYHGDRLVGMGRILSDGVITGIICGLGVSPNHQGIGIGRKLMDQLIEQCDRHRIIPQLMCSESLEPYYETMGFEKFAIGMTRKRKSE